MIILSLLKYMRFFFFSRLSSEKWGGDGVMS